MKKRDKTIAELGARGFNPAAVEDAILECSLPATQKLVAVAILRHWSRKSPRPTVGTRRLARLASCHIGTAQTAVRALVEAGLVQVAGGVRQRFGCVYDLSTMAPGLRVLLESDRNGGSEPDREGGSDQLAPSDRIGCNDLIGSGLKSDRNGGSKGLREGLRDPKAEECAPARATTKPVKRRSTKQQRPDAWKPNAQHEAFGRQHGLDLIFEAAQFADHHDAKASTFADWDAAFRTWLRSAVSFQAGRGNGRRAGPQPSGGTFDASNAGKPEWETAEEGVA